MVTECAADCTRKVVDFPDCAEMGNTVLGTKLDMRAGPKL
jgi:hypothetical protein